MVDELLPLLMAGQEPAAAGLTWILDRLARHAELAAHFLRSAPDDPLRTATVRDALRLRPAVHTVARRLTEPRAVGGYDLPAGAVVAVPIVLVHRDPAAFPGPDAFRPERFLGEDLQSLPYLPAVLRRLDLKPLSKQPERMVVRGTVLVPHHGELAVAPRR